MRSIPCVVAVAALLSSASAGADVSKAYQAAKDHLPATIPAIGAIDVAAVAKLPAFGKLLELLKKEERDIREGLGLVQQACGFDPTTVVDGVVIAGDPAGNDDDITVFLQLTIDRTKASSCLESMMKAVEKRKPVSIKQNGMFTEATVGKETAFFAWATPNVVAFTADPEKKATLERMIGGKKGFAKAPVAGQLAKVDAKAVAFGAVKLSKELDSDLPITAAYGHVLLAGANATATIVGTATTPDSAGKLMAELKSEIAREVKRDRTPATIKKIMNAIAITTAGADVTIKGTASTGDVLDAFLATMKKQEEPPMPAEKTPAKKL